MSGAKHLRWVVVPVVQQGSIVVTASMAFESARTAPFGDARGSRGASLRGYWAVSRKTIGSTLAAVIPSGTA